MKLITAVIKPFKLEDVRQALTAPENTADFGRSEPEWLSLWSIEHPGTPHLCGKGKIDFDLPLTAVTPPTGRAYRLWANKARAEQDQLHQVAWLTHLNGD